MGVPKAVFHEQREISKRPERLRDKEWELLEPLLPPPKRAGRPIKYYRWEVVNAIRYVLRTGCAWRMLPHDLPPVAHQIPLLSHMASRWDPGADT